ncbi:class I SAM-dependent methyltransferase [Nocardioidaceae bacterium]|nr:class I SAM-dependent methyltransferase [Nocardioidaceae bacterium]
MDAETSRTDGLDPVGETLRASSAPVAWADARAANLANWQDRVSIHEVAYGLDDFDDPAHLSDVVTYDLERLAEHLGEGPLDGLEVCHLQCHIGTDTVSLARAGAARVVGVDFSPAALASTATLAERAGVAERTAWVETDVLDARAAVSGEFDVVYTSIGTISWLEDLDRWAQQIAALLGPGALFYFRDGHPFMDTLDEHAPGLTAAYRYFPNGRAREWDDAGSYVGDGTVEHSCHYDYPHSISEVLNALVGAGLSIVAMHEDDVLPWQFSPRMVKVAGGWAWPGVDRERVPLTWTVVARAAHRP